MFIFVFVKKVNFDQFLQNYKFQKFANFRIKIIPNVDSFGLVLKKTFPSMIFHKKRIRFTLFLLINGKKKFLIRNFLEITSDHNIQICVKMCSF